MKRYHRPGRRRQFLALAFLTLTLVSLMSPFTSLSAQDDGEGIECPPGTVFDQETNECESNTEDELTPTTEPTESPTFEPTTEPTAEPTQEPLATPTETPREESDTTIYVNKYTCAPGYLPTAPDANIVADCSVPTDGVTFTLTGENDVPLQSNTGDAIPGAVMFGGLEPGSYTITETQPDGTVGTVFGFCPTPVEPGPIDQSMFSASTDITLVAGQTVNCVAWNFVADDISTPVTGEEGGYADITIYKWECPAGYDPLAMSAYPMVDCTVPLNGVTFTLEGSGPTPLQTDTGDSIDGAVVFGYQEIGDWTITETLPDGYEAAFVYECNGVTVDAVQPVPLQLGNVLGISPADGDSITCNWFNIPESDPDNGHLVIEKYVCTTEQFVSEVDCEIYEGGVDVAVTIYDPIADTWNDYATLTTDRWGRIDLTDIPATSYGVEEVDLTPCSIDISAIDRDRNIAVESGATTTVKIYNCAWDEAEPNKTPEKWPNTGALQTELDCPAVSASNTPATAAPEADSGCYPALAPVAIRIDAIDVESEVETLETVDGAMQAPTGPQIVSWYKETSRLGEKGNIVLAGHLNYWGVPEGVFYNLADLEEGDMIQLWDIDGASWEYQVTSVDQVPADIDPTEILADVEDEETLTIITCGGEWNTEAGEYDERTIVKAVRVPANE